jgi:hypothetical protein
MKIDTNTISEIFAKDAPKTSTISRFVRGSLNSYVCARPMVLKYPCKRRRAFLLGNKVTYKKANQRIIL